MHILLLLACFGPLDAPVDVCRPPFTPLAQAVAAADVAEKPAEGAALGARGRRTLAKSLIRRAAAKQGIRLTDEQLEGAVDTAMAEFGDRDWEAFFAALAKFIKEVLPLILTLFAEDAPALADTLDVHPPEPKVGQLIRVLSALDGAWEVETWRADAKTGFVTPVDVDKQAFPGGMVFTADKPGVYKVRMLAVEDGKPVIETTAVVVQGPRAPPEVEPDVPDPVEPDDPTVDTGPLYILLVHESDGRPTWVGQLIYQVRQDAVYATEGGQHKFVVTDDDVTPQENENMARWIAVAKDRPGLVVVRKRDAKILFNGPCPQTKAAFDALIKKAG